MGERNRHRKALADRRLRRRARRGASTRRAEDSPASGAIVGAALAVQAAALLGFGLFEPARRWRAGAVAGSVASAAAAVLVWVFGRRRWVRWTVVLSLAGALPLFARAHVKAGGGKRRK